MKAIALKVKSIKSKYILMSITTKIIMRISTSMMTTILLIITINV